VEKIKEMRKILFSIVLLAFSSVANSTLVVYYDPLDNLQAKADYLADLAAYATITESFEDDAVWGTSRSSSVASTTSQGLIWKSNSFNSSTVDNGGAHDGDYVFYSNPHGDTTDTSGIEPCNEFDGETASFDDPCWLNDGWVVTSAEGETLYGIGGWITSTTKGGKITFLLDGVNVNVDRDGDPVNDWTFIGVIDTDGFTSVEILELRGTDGDGVFIWGDDFTVGVSAIPVPAAVWLFGSGLLGLVGMARRKKAT
jgi:hypothetical protein